MFLFGPEKEGMGMATYAMPREATLSVEAVM